MEYHKKYNIPNILVNTNVCLVKPSQQTYIFNFKKASMCDKRFIIHSEI